MYNLNPYLGRALGNLSEPFFMDPKVIKIASDITRAHRVAFETVEETRAIKFEMIDKCR